MVHALGVVPRKIGHELAVEDDRRHKVAHVEINKLILDRAIEPLHMSIHLRCLGIGVVVGEMKPAHFLVKMFLEFGTIVGQDELKREREYLKTHLKELFGGKRGVRSGRPCERESSEDVFKGDDVSPASIYVFFNRVKGDTVAGVDRFKILWFP